MSSSGEVEDRLGVHPQIGERGDQRVDLARELAVEAARRRARAAVAVAASIRSATLSACARSSLPFRNARFVNSPGAARRAPSSTQRASTRRSTDGPPWPWNSTTLSPV